MKPWIIDDPEYTGYQNNGLVSFDLAGLKQDGARTVQRATKEKKKETGEERA